MRHVRLSCLSYIADSSRRELSFVRFWHSGVLPVDLSRRNSCPVRNFWRAFGFLMILGNNILNTTPQAFFRIFELLSFSLWTKRPPALQQDRIVLRANFSPWVFARIPSTELLPHKKLRQSSPQGRALSSWFIDRNRKQCVRLFSCNHSHCERNGRHCSKTNSPNRANFSR